MLYAFVENQRNKKDNDNVAVTYAVAGQAEDKHGNLVSLIIIKKSIACTDYYNYLFVLNVYNANYSKLKR